MDGIKHSKERVSVFATTNMPWELDVAALRRFERKIMVPMPDRPTRRQIITLHAGSHHRLTQQEIDFLAAHTDGYSGSDLSTVVNDALMRPIKEVQQATHFRKTRKLEILQLKDHYQCDD